MVRMNVVFGSLLVVLSLLAAGVGLYLMDMVAKAQEEGFPEDFDDHFTYGGLMEKLDMTTGAVVRTNFTVDRHIRVDTVLDDDQLAVEETIEGKENSTGVVVTDLQKRHTYTVDKHDLIIYRVTNHVGYEKTYNASEEVQWIFPHPVEKEDAKVWNMNILTYSEAKYLGEEKRGGVDCYVFRGEEIDFEIPLTQDQAAALPPGSTMKISLWEKAWVHPLTGTIVDFAKEIIQYLYLPELPAIPEIAYPDDLNSTTTFVGSVTLFDQGSYSFVPMDNISAVRTLNGSGSESGLAIHEIVEVFDPMGYKIDLLSSELNVLIDPVTGEHDDGVRSGHYLFPPTGVEKNNYTFWDDGFGKEVVAEYIGEENEDYAPLSAYVYMIDVQVEPYLPGGTATLRMTYYVEPTTGIVLDARKELTNWRAQDARRLPLDTGSINKTVHLDTTVTIMDPMTQQVTAMDLVAVQMINCSGYTDMTFQTAKFEETSWLEFPNGSVYSPPTTSRFGVDAKTMAYVEVPAWSTATRTGSFTFPVGLLNETGEVTPMFSMYNSDLRTSLPVVLVDDEVDFMGRQAARYMMSLTDLNLTPEQAEAVLGTPLPLPGAVMKYSCDWHYIVDIDTGQLLNLSRATVNKIYPPTYPQIYSSLDTTSVYKGMMGDDNLTMTHHVTSAPGPAVGVALISVETSIAFDNGSYLIEPSVSTFPIEIMTHKILNATLGETGLYWNFPPSPMDPAEVMYPMVLPFGDQDLFGVASMLSYNDDIVRYVWTNTSVMDAGLFNPMFAGMNVSVETTQRWVVDRMSGSILDYNITMLVYAGSPDPTYTIVMAPTEGTLAYYAQSNQVILWALAGTGVPVLSVDAVLSGMDSTISVMKSGMLSNALLVADGEAPALDLDIRFNAATVEQQKAIATATLEKLGLLEKLKMAHGLDMLLKSKGNKVVYVYYKQVPEDIDENKGSVAYWGDFAKEKEDQIRTFGTTIPFALFALAVILAIAAVSVFLMKPKEEKGPEEE